jgi:hypothetical protein
MSDIRDISRLGLILLTLSLSACHAAPRQRPVAMGSVDTGSGSLAAARKYLEGRWTLLSFEVRPPGQSPIALKGSGTLQYDEYGNLQMDVRADQATVALLERAGVSTTNGVVSTTGRTVLDLQAKTLTYQLEGQPPPAAATGPLALSRPRHWQIAGNVLTLTTLGDDGRPLAVGRWMKE